LAIGHESLARACRVRIGRYSMKIKHRRRVRAGALLLAGVLAAGPSAGCTFADNPFYLYGLGVANGVLDGAISLTLNSLSAFVTDAFFPDAGNDDAET
jgi:hypothetical protein